MTRRGVRGWFRLPIHDRRLSAADVDAELTAHLEERVERLMARGMSEADARAEAERRLGGLTRARYNLVRAALDRDTRLALRDRARGWLEDLRYVRRSVFRERGYAVVVIIALALGIGANATMFGVLDRLLLSGPAHVVEPDALYRFYINLPVAHSDEVDTFAPLPGAALAAFREGVRSLEHVSGYTSWSPTLGAGAAARRLDVGAVSASFFPLLGVQPVIGRFFDAAEDLPPRGDRVIVLGHALWRTQFGGRRDVLGETIELSGQPFTVIGVAPAGFTGVTLEPRDGWVPLGHRAVSSGGPDWHASWGGFYVSIVGRLRPDATPERAAAAATATWRAGFDVSVLERLSAAWFTVAGIRTNERGAEPLEARVARWLLAVAGVVLLVACANVANLYFARGLRRRREIAVRLTLGISRTRLLRLLLLESFVLALLGGVAALAVAYWGAELVRGVLLPHVDWTTSPLDVRVLGFAAALTAFVGIVTGLIPALQATRPTLAPALTGSVHAPPAPGRARGVLAIVQAAFCVVLLVGAGLFVRSLHAVQSMDLGVDAERVIRFGLQWQTPPDLSAEERARLDARRAAFIDDALVRIAAVPGVAHVSVAVGGAFSGSFGASIRVEGMDSIPSLPGGGPYLSGVTGDYFATLGTPLLRGRAFQPGEGAGSEPVMIVSRITAERVWPGEDPLERCAYLNREPTCRRVVGVVDDVRRLAIVEPPAMQIYVPLGQEPAWMAGSGTPLFVRAAIRPARLIEPVRHALYEMEPSLRYVHPVLFSDVVAPQQRAWRLGASLFVICGVLALAIAAIGLYSVIAYLVLHRTHEIGVRMALGAERRDVVGMVVRQALNLAGAGLAIGAVVALLVAPHLEPLLFDTPARDLAVLAAAAGTLALAALAAGIVPALRASAVAPTQALREY